MCKQASPRRGKKRRHGVVTLTREEEEELCEFVWRTPFVDMGGDESWARTVNDENIEGI